MAHRLDHRELRERYHRQAPDLVIQFASVFQGGIISAAAFALIQIFQSSDDIAIRTMLWAHSLILGFIAFYYLCERALHMVQAGLELIFVLPLLCLVQIALYAVISTDGLGAEAWRYWYHLATAYFAVGWASNAFALRAMRAEFFDESTSEIFGLQRAMIRQDVIQGLAATIFTAAVTAWLLMMPVNWQYGTAFVATHLALTVVNGAVDVWRHWKGALILRETIDREDERRAAEAAL